MTARIIDGKAVAARLRKEVREEVLARLDAGKEAPTLAVVMVGDDPASAIYVRNKKNACAEVGIRSLAFDLPADTGEERLLSLIEELNQDSSVHGILVQMPVPRHIDPFRITEAIDPHKDVDGFHPYNIGRLAIREPLLRSCTPKGVMTLLDETGLDLAGRDAVVVGASNHVGRPMALELLMAGCTVTVCHSRTRDLAAEVARAEVVVAAVGRAELIRGEWIKEGAVVIDIGMNRGPNGLLGDVDFPGASQRASWITPVPGGVGPMTVASLMENTLEAAIKQG